MYEFGLEFVTQFRRTETINMDKRVCLLAFVVAASLTLSTPASAGVLYDNGPISGAAQLGAWALYNNGVTNDAAADSFTLTGTSTLSGVANIGLWLHPGDSPLSLDWGISASPDYSQSLGGGTVGLTNTVWCSACGWNYYDVYASSFSLPNIVLGPGTYWLTLQGGVSSQSAGMFWDINNGPSVAYETQVGGNVANYRGHEGSNSDSFQILGDSSAPEPAGTALFLSGLALVASLARRKMRA
jgi:hypothetical protein